MESPRTPQNGSYIYVSMCPEQPGPSPASTPAQCLFLRMQLFGAPSRPPHRSEAHFYLRGASVGLAKRAQSASGRQDAVRSHEVAEPLDAALARQPRGRLLDEGRLLGVVGAALGLPLGDPDGLAASSSDGARDVALELSDGGGVAASVPMDGHEVDGAARAS